MTGKPSNPNPQIKAKSDPEALLNDLSSSLKSFQSTVRTWTSSNSTSFPLSSTSYNSSGDSMRQARLGLGAKPQRQAVAGDSVSGNIALKNQLTGQLNNQNIQNNQKFKFTHSHTQKHNSHTLTNNTNSIKVNKQTTKKRNDLDDEDGGGRASLIKSRNKN
jgi:hypothetical protein